MSFLGFAAGASALIWLGLLFAHGRFWRAQTWLDPDEPAPHPWPGVVALIPARDEAAVIGESVASHVSSTYPGAFSIILVDDDSTDGTAEIARTAALGARVSDGPARHLHVLRAPALAAGWTGKLAAQHAGLRASLEIAPEARYLLLTDADIVHAPGTLRALVARAHNRNLALVSLMARLDDRGFWGSLLIPAFVFFFQMLYPFPRANRPTDPLAAAAGGCMLVERERLIDTGGFEAIRGALIDDCTLAAQLKGQPPTRGIWLGLTRDVISRRDNRRFGSIWTMVARTAYAQLSHSPWQLAGTVVGMALVFLAGPLAVLLSPWHGDIVAAGAGAAAWSAMTLAQAPTLKSFDRPAWQGLALPVSAALYTAMTVGSAWNHWRGRGGFWKGRTYGA